MNFDMQDLINLCTSPLYCPKFLDECLGMCKREQPKACLLILTKACQSADNAVPKTAATETSPS